MMRAFFGLCVALLIFGCSDDSAEEDSSGKDVVVMWHAYRGDEAAALEAVIDQYNQEQTDHFVRLVSLPYDAMTNKLRVAIPRGNGPDLFIFAHDKVGGWAKKGLIEPVGYWASPKTLDTFLPQTLPGLVYEEGLYGLPLAYKTLTLFYDKSLVDTPPKTTDELIQMSQGIRARGSNYWGLAYPAQDFYYHSLWLHGFGGQVLPRTGQPQLRSDSMKKSIQFAHSFYQRDFIPKGVDAAQIAALFKSHSVGFVIDGPWFREHLADHPSWAVAPLPAVSETGKKARPYLGVEAVMISGHSRKKGTAYAVAEYLTSDESAMTRWSTARQLVANRAVYRSPQVAQDEFTQAFLRQLPHTEPMSNRPAMDQLWGPLVDALSKTVVLGMDVDAALELAERAVGEVIE